MIDRLDRDGETWDQSSGSAQSAEPAEEAHVSEANRKIERLQAETNKLNEQVAKISYGSNTSDKRPTTPKFHDGTCQVVGRGNTIKVTLKIEGGAYVQAAFSTHRPIRRHSL